MLEAARILGGLAACLLVAAIAAWGTEFGVPAVQRRSGSSEPSSRPSEVALRLLVTSFSLSSLAAALAIAAWFAG